MIDLSDPKWADLREQLTDSRLLSIKDSAAVLRWLETGYMPRRLRRKLGIWRNAKGRARTRT